MSTRLGIFVTHPIQYFAPLWRTLAAAPGIELEVFFFSDHSVRGRVDPGFGVPVAWDVPVLEGYPSRFISREVNLLKPWGVKLRSARSLLESEHLDAVLIHGYTHRFEWQLLKAASPLGLPIVMRGEFSDAPRPESRGWARSTARRVYLEHFLSRVAAFCYVGERARRYLTGQGVSADRLFFSPYSVDAPLLEAQRVRFPREESRAALGIPPEAHVLLFSGKLTPRKDPLLLVDALEQLVEKERVWLIYLGDGELRADVARRGRDLLGDRLMQPGFVNQSQLGRFFAAADIFVLPSRYETWGLVVNEAQQFGLPVLCSSSVGSAADLVHDGETGFLFDPGDARGLAAGLRRLLSDGELRHRMGENGRQRIAGYTPAASARGILEAVAHVVRQ